MSAHVHTLLVGDVNRFAEGTASADGSGFMERLYRKRIAQRRPNSLECLERN
jgi:hypothetical protein